MSNGKLRLHFTSNPLHGQVILRWDGMSGGLPDRLRHGGSPRQPDRASCQAQLARFSRLALQSANRPGCPRSSRIPSLLELSLNEAEDAQCRADITRTRSLRIAAEI